MNSLRWFADRWLVFSLWWQHRRELLEALRAAHLREKAALQQEINDLRTQLAIEKKNGAFMALVIAKHRAIIEADIALQKRYEADALNVTPKK